MRAAKDRLFTRCPSISSVKQGTAKAALIATLLIGVVAYFGLAAAADFDSIGASRDFRSAPDVHETVFQATRGSGPFDHIALHRYARDSGSSAHPSLVTLYLPGTNMNGEAAIDDPRYSLEIYLAQQGVDLWALDYRTHFIPPQTPLERLIELKDWTDELFESDIETAAQYIMQRTGGNRIFVAGFSRGATFAYLYAARHPDHVQGLVIFDGMLADGREGAPSRGDYATDVGGRHLTWEKRQTLLKMVIENPGGPAPIPKYKTAGDNLANVVYYSAGFGGKGGLANPFGGFSDLNALARTLIGYDRYWPVVQDYKDPESSEHANALAKSKIPVIAFSSTNIAPDWPQRVAKSAASTGSKDVTVRRLAGWGHLDVICGSHAEQQVFAPAAEWLKQHLR